MVAVQMHKYQASSGALQLPSTSRSQGSVSEFTMPSGYGSWIFCPSSLSYSEEATPSLDTGYVSLLF